MREQAITKHTIIMQSQDCMANIMRLVQCTVDHEILDIEMDKH